MVKFLIPLAAAVSTLAVATPASAQWYPQPQPRGYAYGYNNYGQVRALQVRLNRMQSEIRRLAQYRMITRNEYRNLLDNSRDIERSLRHNARDGRGLTAREMYNTQRKMVRLEQKVARDVRDGRHWGYRW
ncbi:MAG TPA: hypothetical protein VFP53_08295 [Sphingomicrobium sp.]|nr:hypothetical protein [Sphingomicrobium sp.]